MNDTYTAAEFAKCYSLRGYGRKKDALKWLEEHGMETAQEADFMRCYHEMNDRKVLAHGRKWTAMRADGTNQSAPQNQPNSRGETFNALMAKEMRQIDAMERAARRRKEREQEERV